MTEKKKHRTGSEVHPSKYKPSMCAAVKVLMSKGCSKQKAATALGISVRTFYNYTYNHPEFKTAVELGEELSYAHWEDMGERLASEGSAAVWALNMANRFGWKSKNEVTGKDDGPIQIEIIEFKE